MAKIGSTMITMPSLNFGDSNELMNDGLKTLLDAFKPVQTQMDANFAERQSNATGSLLEQISQGMPQDYNNNPEARALFDSQISQYAKNAGLAREGVNLQDVYATLNEVGKTRDANRTTFLNNQSTDLKNQDTQDVRDYTLAENLFTQGKISEEQFRGYVGNLGVSTQGGLNILGGSNIDLYNKMVTPTVALQQTGTNFSNGQTIDKVQDALTGLSGRLERNSQRGGNSTAKTKAPLQGSFGNSGGATHGLNSQTLSYAPTISKYAQQHGVPAKLITAMIGAESSGKNGATSSASAKGLMQIIPDTWNSLTKGTNANIRNPEDNINYGTQYIKQHLDKYAKYGDKGFEYALMAYNWGEGNVDEYIKTGKGKNGKDVPKETKDYLARVKANINGLDVPDASQRNPFMDYGDEAQQATQRGDNSDYLKYSNKKGQTRSLPANPQLETSISDVLASMGLTGDVHSGGQNDKTGRKGGPRHDHGNSVDMDFYKDGRKLSYKNKEDIPIFQEIVQRLKANGVTGFGAGEGYMTDGRMHVGYGSPAVWGSDRTNATAAEWLKEAFNSDVSGFASADQLVQQATQPLLNLEDLAVLNGIKERGRQGESEVFNKLQEMVAQNIPSPTKVNYAGGYYSPEMLAQRNQRLVDTNSQMLNNSTQGINDLVDFTNDTTTTVAEREIMSQDAESRLNQISAEGFTDREPLSKYVESVGAFEKWLGEDGITPEMFESFPLESQVSLINKRRDIEKANSSNSRAKESSVKSFDSSRLNLDDSFYKESKDVLTARHRILSRQKREQHEKEDTWYNMGNTDTENFLRNNKKFEEKAALAVDKVYKQFSKNYRGSDTQSISILGSSNEDKNKVINYTIEEYDKIILSKEGSDLGYLSKNLTKGFNIESERTMNLAATRALDRAAEEQRKKKAKISKEYDGKSRISAAETLGDSALQSLLKGKK